MRIAGRLSETTLGDVLGSLFRARTTGLLRLTETRGAWAGRTHGIYLRQGLVVAVDTGSLEGDDPTCRRPASLRRRLADQLGALFGLAEAVVTFHVVCAPPHGAILPLRPEEYLHGKPRARDREPKRRPFSRAASSPRGRDQALSMLGLEPDATLAEVTRAFRRRARELHPDLHRCETGDRRSAEQRFAALSAAYHALIG
jgi:hypothetical protein